MAPFSTRSYVITGGSKRVRLSSNSSSAPTSTPSTPRYLQLSVKSPEDVVDRIFYWCATFRDPFFLRKSSPVDQGRYLPLNEDMIIEMSESLETIKCIRRTCKVWYGLIEKYFFRYLSCSSGNDEVWRAMATCVGRSGNGSLNAGRHVQRLVLQSDDCSGERLSYIMQILGGCLHARYIKLTIVDILDIVPNHFQSVVNSFTLGSSRKIQHLDINLGFMFNEGYIFSSMFAFRNLSVLTITDAFGDFLDENVIIEPLYLANVHTIHITSCTKNRFPQIEHFIMPNFQHLSVFCIEYTDGAVPFFRLYGSQLISFQFAVPDMEMHILLDLCPNLQDIIFSLKDFIIHSPPTFYFGHKNVLRIGIRDFPPPIFTFRDIKSAMEELVTNITELNFPNLDIVCFLDLNRRALLVVRSNPDFRRYWNETWIQGLNDIGVVVEDGEGVIAPVL